MLYSTILTLAACATLSSAAGHGERFVVHRRNGTVSAASSRSMASTTAASSPVSPGGTTSTPASGSVASSASSPASPSITTSSPVKSSTVMTAGPTPPVTSVASSSAAPASSASSAPLSSSAVASSSATTTDAPASSAVASSAPASSVAASSSAPAASSSVASGGGVGVTGVNASNNTVNVGGKRQLAGLPIPIPALAGLPLPALALPNVADLSGSVTDLTGVLSSVGNVGPIVTGPITGNSVGILASRDLLGALPIPNLSSLTSGGGLPVVSELIPSLPLGSVTGLLGSTAGSASTTGTSASSDAGLGSILKREPQVPGLPALPFALPALPLALPSLPIALPNVADLSGSVTSLTGVLGSVGNVGGVETPEVSGNSIALGKRQLGLPIPDIPALSTPALGGLPVAGLIAPITGLVPSLAGSSNDLTGMLNSVGNVGGVQTGPITGNAIQVL